MASKKVLTAAIIKLKEVNQQLLNKMHEASTIKEIENIREKIARNESMILDFEFQLTTRK